jgi:hypothetical protein
VTLLAYLRRDNKDFSESVSLSFCGVAFSSHISFGRQAFFIVWSISDLRDVVPKMSDNLKKCSTPNYHFRHSSGPNSITPIFTNSSN